MAVLATQILTFACCHHGRSSRNGRQAGARYQFFCSSGPSAQGIPVPLTLQRHADHIAVSGTGLYTLLEAQEHFRELSAVVGEYRKARRAIRVLVDLRGGAPQTPEVVSHIGKANEIVFRDGDRVAIIVVSALLKMQINRIHTRIESEVFVSDVAAREFLFRKA